MSIIEEFNQLKRDLEALFSSKELIEKQICEKASRIFMLNNECISLSNNNEHTKNDVQEAYLEICNYISDILEVRLNSDSFVELKQCKANNRNITGKEEGRIVQHRISSLEDDQSENKKSLIHANSYAFKNIYKLDDFMNTTNWLWNKELKSKIVEVVSNRNNEFPNATKPSQIGGDFSSISLGHNKMHCNALPKLVCKTVKIEENNPEQTKYINPLKSYIEKAFKLES
ncbi:unnamed protein product [Cryptosporidium hominis]|uniref:Uncharacterized protein n=1 Tax=Cryptosporidium hominis TaxID=237895 RepID=A0A0S4TF60_CRYHO|nr:hypothetical protein [Cryptosporidium hominis TU502]OLQ15810.1 hypothetical protein ChTU502y2012_295g0380 [Cryptosporidium hominis]PPA64295.1 hypothetical protein ChUKH1_03980 [Cryptosporidium hominis]PPS96336.1 Uncharacterized protein GY17_00001696 [Cryptosporidium hominis]CUV05628.1 unnamed protein product [Cryptosporidium hominis]|eukprot:PPS96336.1 Uncharacterized protein GY17_00001696 [Cryptosporidium hominis]